MSETNCRRFMFAGPSFCGSEQLMDEAREIAQLRSPVQRHDIKELVATHQPGVMILVDGYFQQCLAVGHAEIRVALSAGWSVWGLSSLGAIRAYEMRDLGVRGYGRVYRHFYEHDDFRDDEVALVHEPDPPYRTFSEPLIHIRFFLRELVSLGLISATLEDRVLARLMSMWFGDRTLELLRSYLLELAPQAAAAMENVFGDFQPFRAKCHDLCDFIRERPWE